MRVSREELVSQIETCRDRKGQLTPKHVVKKAQDPAHPLHSRFEWDNEIAGPKYRLIQARELLMSVRISFPDDEEPDDIRYYHAIRASDEAQYNYEDIEHVLADDVKRKILLRDMEREWRQMEQRFAKFQEFWKMVRVADRRNRKASEKKVLEPV